MTKDEFKDFVRRIRSIYPNRPFLTDKEQFDLWWEYMQPLKLEFFLIAEKRYVADSAFPPTIADITTRYKAVKDHNMRLKAELLDIFNLARQYYPVMRWTNDDEKAFLDAIKSQTFDECKAKAKKILNSLVGHPEDTEKTFAELVGGRKW